MWYQRAAMYPVNVNSGPKRVASHIMLRVTWKIRDLTRLTTDIFLKTIVRLVILKQTQLHTIYISSLFTMFIE